MPCRLLFVSILCFYLAVPSAAEEIECGYAPFAEGRAFDPAVGGDVRNYPPDPQVRFQHMRLELRFDDLTSRSFKCTETLRFATLGRPLDKLKLDAVDLLIEKIADAQDKPLTFRYDDEHLTVHFKPDLPAETNAELHITYTCRRPQAGMTWALPDAAYPNRPAVVHTQGQTEDNRYWFVSHDYPNARFTSEIIATVPDGNAVISNGKLVERTPAENGFVRFHYLQEQPHVSYLVSLIVGQLVAVKDKWRDRDVEYWVPAGREEDARRTFGKTPQMMELFSKITGVDYPYAKYAQTVCPLFGSGGMENTTATTLHEDCLVSERAALDQDDEELIAHELAHQWFGDRVTCKAWPHIWLNEGFATFMADVWFEHSRGPDEYIYEVWKTKREVMEEKPAPGALGIVYPEFENPWEVFHRPGGDPYSKGSCVLHMLRCSMGDDLFWQAVHQYLTKYAWNSAETDDFRKIIDELTGRSYERFFQQWLYRGNVPKIRIAYEWDDAAKQARVTLQQTQKIARQYPAIVADVEVWCVANDGHVEKRTVRLEGLSASVAFAGSAEPAQIVVDPAAALLAEYENTLPLKMLTQQALAGPTMASRLNAVLALKDKDRDEAREALKSILMDESIYWGLRAAAADALGRMQSAGARDVLLAALAEGKAVKNPKVRTDAVIALGKYRTEAVRRTLLRLARHDESEVVEARATEALGHQQVNDEVIAVLVENAKKDSHLHWIRRDAAKALAELRDPRGLKTVMDFASYGQPTRSRTGAIDALGLFGRDRDQRNAVRKLLIDLLADPQERPRETAIEALGASGDEDAIPALRVFAGSSAPKWQRRRAEDAIQTITKNKGEPAKIKDLLERMDRLEKSRESSEKRITTLEASPKTTTQPAPIKP